MKPIAVVLACAMLFGPLAACSGDTAKQAKKEAKADTLQAGEYEVTDKVEELRSTDNSTPATAMKAAAAGEASPTSRICVAKDGAIDPAVFAEAGDKCASTGSYMRGGRLSYQFNCTRAGKGGLSQLADGKFTADSFEASVSTTTYFSGPGDYSLNRTLTGKRVGECPPAQPDAAPRAAAQ